MSKTFVTKPNEKHLHVLSNVTAILTSPFLSLFSSQLSPKKAIDMKYPDTIALKFDEEHRQVGTLHQSIQLIYMFVPGIE